MKSSRGSSAEMLLNRHEPVAEHFFVVVYEGDEVAAGRRDAGIQRIGLSRLRFVQISQTALEAWPEAADDVRRPVGRRVVHHEHPHLESARHLGGEQALERPGQERLAVERRQDDVDNHQSTAARPGTVAVAAAGASSMASYNSSTARAVAVPGL